MTLYPECLMDFLGEKTMSDPLFWVIMISFFFFFGFLWLVVKITFHLQ